MNLEATPISKVDVQRTVDDLKANPPMKFDLAQKVRVFNAQIEFVDFEVRGALYPVRQFQFHPTLWASLKIPRFRACCAVPFN